MSPKRVVQQWTQRTTKVGAEGCGHPVDAVHGHDADGVIAVNGEVVAEREQSGVVDVYSIEHDREIKEKKVMRQLLSSEHFAICS